MPREERRGEERSKNDTADKDRGDEIGAAVENIGYLVCSSTRVGLTLIFVAFAKIPSAQAKLGRQ